MTPVVPGTTVDVLALALTAIAAAVCSEAWRRWALRRGVLDIPGRRSSHVVATPRGAGVGIALAVLAALWLWVPSTPGRDGAMAAITMAAVVGLIDDLRSLAPAWKFAGQILAALPASLLFPWVPPEPLGALPAGGGMVASLAIVLLYVNVWNFMDGINGIAALTAATVGLVVAVAAMGQGGPGVVLAALLAAACLGFLPLNFPRAKVFMGDCGSHALGMALAILVLAAPSPGLAWVAWAASAAFLVDVLGTLLLRALDGESLGAAHRRHLYQLVTRSGYSHARVTTAYAVWMLGSGGAVAMAEAVAGWGAGAAVVVFATTALLWGRLVSRFSLSLKREGRW